uniref:Uncharacterized protein n=1 Tax=Roseihalotalea indica TaxID=2867963 RepID=A0AA49JGP3_9BACT|nr:hypothetical protein K4G66_02845 [Tunicatimonas sp. TK19036]
MTMSFDNIRVGKRYYLSNYGEESRFEILEALGDENFKVKDLVSMDIYELQDLVKYGTSDDFELLEIRGEG